jgi:hypothetical protein
LDILRTGLNPALDPTLNPPAGVAESNETGKFSLNLNWIGRADRFSTERW